MNIRKTNERISAFICGLLTLYIFLITSAQIVCFNVPDWWRNEYIKYNTTQYVTGEMSLDDAVYVTEQMLEYCIGRLDSLDDVNATIDGTTSPFFTEREKLHLIDCRNIFLNALRFRSLSLIITTGLLFFLFFSIRKRNVNSSSSEFARLISGGYLLALAVIIILAFIILIIGSINFTYLFTEFHELFFDNDLWILNPAVDNLVNIMQEQVFADTALLILKVFILISSLFALTGLIVLKKTRSRSNHKRH
ncbi:MAG TPA: DUF1461 domain-containing protein [Mogibacterium sp.]|nr:DUF1461 domain-containing protein [Mogibacterium sp.]